MRLLLDTRVLLWWLADSDRLTPDYRELIEDGANEVFVSAVSVAEVSIMASLGKLEAPDDITTAAIESGLALLDLKPIHAEALRSLPWHHRDPFDRMLIAQARTENLILLSVDPRIAEYEVRVR